MVQKKLEIEKLRQIVKEEIIQEFAEEGKRKVIHQVIVDIAKAASNGLKALKGIRGKKMPTSKSTQAVAARIDALQAIFEDMLKNPTSYLDTGDPSEVVKSHLKGLDDRESAIKGIDGASPPVSG